MEHHVYFWLKDEHKNQADLKAFEEGLSGLFHLKGLLGGFWAVPAKVMARPVVDQSWDYGLTMTFDSVAAHDAYQVDPDHNIFVDRFKSWWARVEVRDLDQAGI